MKNKILSFLLVWVVLLSGGIASAQVGTFTKVRVRDSVVSLSADTDLILRGQGDGGVSIEGNYTLPQQDGVAGEVLTTDGAGNLTFEPDGAGITDATTTGIRFGGVLSVNGGDANKVDITAGEGKILDETDPENPILTNIAWTANIAITPAFSNVLVYLYFDDNSNVVKQTTSAPTRENQALRIWIGRFFSNGSIIVGSANDRDFSRNYAIQMRAVAEALGLVKLEGLIIIPNGVNLSIDRTSGALFDFGSNGQTSPHSKDFSSDVPITFFPADRDSDFGSTTFIDPDNYDNAGVLTIVPNNQWTIQDILFFSSGTVSVQYGQSTYANEAEAFDAISTREYVQNPSTITGIRVAYLLVQEGTTDLNQSCFINTNKFGELGGGTSGAPTGFLEAANNLSDVNDAATSRANIGAGDVTKVGAPVDNQLGVWTGDGTLEGEGDLTYNGSTLLIINAASNSSFLVDSNHSTGFAEMEVNNNAGKGLEIKAFGNSNGTSSLGSSNANESYLSANSTLKILTSVAQSLQLGTNNTLAATIDGTTQDWDFQGNDISAGDATFSGILGQTGSHSASFSTKIINTSVSGHGLLIQAGGITGDRNIIDAQNYLGVPRFKLDDEGNATFSGGVDALTLTGGVLTVDNLTINTNTITSTNNIDFDVPSAANALQIQQVTGNVVVAKNLVLSSPNVPSSASDTGTVGTISWDASYIYICTATDTWKRVAIATW